jgi:hypothetical protein
VTRTITTPQKALRLLAVLVTGSERLPTAGAGGEIGIFRGETRLNALMFWLRNPDYLAWELLDMYADRRDSNLLSFVERMLADEEPVLRRDAMPKWRFGAYEPIDDEMAILAVHRLVRTVMKPIGLKSAGNDFLLFDETYRLARALGGNPAYGWYAERMDVVLKVAGGRSGSDLKDRQYKQLEYASMPSSGLIPPITERVEARLHSLTAGA